MSKVCKINSIHDIDFDSLKSDIEEKLEDKEYEYEDILALSRYYNGGSIRNTKISNAIDEEYHKILYELEMLSDQHECKHDGIIFHEVIGHTHGGDIHRTYCENCDLTIEEYGG